MIVLRQSHAYRKTRGHDTMTKIARLLYDVVRSLHRCCMIVARSPSWTSYQIRKIAGCACAGNAGNVFPRCRFQKKPIVSDPGMHHGTCVTHVRWCMSGSLTCSDGANVPGIPGACAPAILRIWQEAHCRTSLLRWLHTFYACHKTIVSEMHVLQGRHKWNYWK